MRNLLLLSVLVFGVSLTTKAGEDMDTDCEFMKSSITETVKDVDLSSTDVEANANEA